MKRDLFYEDIEGDKRLSPLIACLLLIIVSIGGIVGYNMEKEYQQSKQVGSQANLQRQTTNANIAGQVQARSSQTSATNSDAFREENERQLRIAQEREEQERIAQERAEQARIIAIQQRIEAEQRAVEERRIAAERERTRQINAWANRMGGSGDLIFMSPDGEIRFRTGRSFPDVRESYVVQGKRIFFRTSDERITVFIADQSGVLRNVASFETRRRGNINRVQIYGNMTDQAFEHLGFGVFDIR
ncbi:MAG: hypothetical protein FWE23_11270 [Chitinivibrionia bacterium]|nr:hypothetical protein [Chitinivibrionia bacterium]